MRNVELLKQQTKPEISGISRNKTDRCATPLRGVKNREKALMAATRSERDNRAEMFYRAVIHDTGRHFVISVVTRCI